jgi:hypothetical protein
MYNPSVSAIRYRFSPIFAFLTFVSVSMTDHPSKYGLQLLAVVRFVYHLLGDIVSYWVSVGNYKISWIVYLNVFKLLCFPLCFYLMAVRQGFENAMRSLGNSQCAIF